MDQKPTAPKQYGKIGIVLDERLQRAHQGVLTRLVQSFRVFAAVSILGETIQEDQVLDRMQQEAFDLILLPWHHYLGWKKTEAFWGSTRTSGPTVAGYFCEPINPEMLTQATEFSRTIILDFCSLATKESGIIVRNLLEDSRRCGIRPFFRPGHAIYSENWFHGQGLGHRLDSIVAIPELTTHSWNARAHSIRTVLVGLWSLIYEDGPGKSEFRQAIAGNCAIASLQLAMDERCLLFRLCFQLPGTTPRSLLEKFWHDPTTPGSASQYLLRYSDFLRAHVVSDSHDVEIVVGLFQSAPAEKAPHSLHTLWIEPVTAAMMTEPAFVTAGAEFPYLKALPDVPHSSSRPDTAALENPMDRVKDRHILDAAQKIRELRKVVDEREQIIRELRSGGLGPPNSMTPTDPESLLEAFQSRYFEFKHRIRQYELEIVQIEQAGGSPEELAGLRLRMEKMAERERAWIQVLIKTVTTYTQSLKKSG